MIFCSTSLRPGQLWSMTLPGDLRRIDYVLAILHLIEDPDGIFRIRAIEKSSDGHERIVIVQPPMFMSTWTGLGYKKVV